MKLNPEFERNLWLELTAHRLIALPVVFGLLFLLSFSLNDYRLVKPIAYSAMTLFILFTGIWGTKRATGAVYEEIVGRTWDWQRMSGLDPWAMTWGKLLGSTSFAWYGGVICLLVAVVGVLNDNPTLRDLQWLALALFGVLFSQAFGFLINLIYIRSRPLERARSGGSLYLFVLLLVIVLSWTLGPMNEEQMLWYGMSVPLREFILVTVFLAWLWAVTGAYRVMRREFLHAARPWVWMLFLLSLAGYFGGVESSSAMEWFLIAFFLWWAVTMIALFVEPKDPVMMRGLIDSLGKGDFGKTSLSMPSWLAALLFVLAAALVLLSMSGQTLEWDNEMPVPLGALTVTLVLFVLRDVAIFLLLGFAGDSKRPEVTAVVYLFVLYVVIPALLNAVDLELLTALFLPRPDLGIPLSVGAPVLGTGMALALLLRQWKALTASGQG